MAGQEQVVSLLQKQMQSGRISHAYLLCGTRGTGKTTLARIIAKAINCTDLKEGNPCCRCESCLSIANQSNVDVVELDAATNNGVDSVRDLCEEVSFTPQCSRFRVYIIDEVHMLTLPAFNALLKTLEEPPSHVVFILATTDPDKLPATILSRCQRFDFKPISENTLVARMEEVCKGEGIEADANALALIAHLADGAMRNALSILDQCASRGEKVTYEKVASVTGLGGRTYLSSLLEALSEKRYDETLQISNRLSLQGKNFALACEELLSALRDLLVLKTVNGAEDFLNAPQGEREDLRRLSEGFSAQRLLSLCDTLLNEKERLRQGGNKQIDFELLLFRLCHPETGSGIAALEARIAELERRMAQGAPAAPVPKAIPKKDKVEAKAEEPPKAPTLSEQKTAPKAPPFWAEVVDAAEPSLFAALRSCTPLLNGNVITLQTKGTAAFLMAMPLYQKNLLATIARVTGKEYQIDVKPAEEQINGVHLVEGFKVED